MDMKCKRSLWSLHYCFIMATVTKDTVLTYTSALFSICHFILSFWLFEGQTPQLHGPTKCVRVQGDDGGGYKPLSLQHLICHIKWNFWLSQWLTFLPAQHFFLEICYTHWEGITFICSDSPVLFCTHRFISFLHKWHRSAVSTHSQMGKAQGSVLVLKSHKSFDLGLSLCLNTAG